MSISTWTWSILHLLRKRLARWSKPNHHPVNSCKHHSSRRITRVASQSTAALFTKSSNTRLLQINKLKVFTKFKQQETNWTQVLQPAGWPTRIRPDQLRAIPNSCSKLWATTTVSPSTPITLIASRLLGSTSCRRPYSRRLAQLRKVCSKNRWWVLVQLMTKRNHVVNRMKF